MIPDLGQSPTGTQVPHTTLRMPLHRRVVDALRDMILEGQFLPGEHIAELALCRSMQISRTPLREALKVLASEGLVELLPNRGARVISLTLSDLRHLFSVVSTLDGLAGELAAERVTEKQLSELTVLQECMREAFEATDHQSYFHLNRTFHGLILKASGNLFLLAAHTTLSGRIQVSRYQANFTRTRWIAALREHQAIIDLLQLRRSFEVGALLRSHIMNKFEFISEAVNGDRPTMGQATNEKGTST